MNRRKFITAAAAATSAFALAPSALFAKPYYTYSFTIDPLPPTFTNIVEGIIMIHAHYLAVDEMHIHEDDVQKFLNYYRPKGPNTKSFELETQVPGVVGYFFGTPVSTRRDIERDCVRLLSNPQYGNVMRVDVYRNRWKVIEPAPHVVGGCLYYVVLQDEKTGAISRCEWM
jgi:hypothetical protein